MILKSIQNGNWSDPQTWDIGKIPKDGDTIEIYHLVRCEPNMKPLKGGQVRLMTPDAGLDTSRINFSGFQRGSGLTPNPEG
jgi:hypothetical protein